MQFIAPDPYKVTVPPARGASITATVGHSGRPATTTAVVMSGADAQQLAGDADHLQEDTPAIGGCLGIVNSPQRVTIVFTAAAGTVELDWDLECRTITFPSAPLARPRVASSSLLRDVSRDTRLTFP